MVALGILDKFGKILLVIFKQGVEASESYTKRLFWFAFAIRF